MTLQEKLQEFISRELLGGEVGVENEDSLLADGMVDSLGMLRLVTFIEESLNTSIPPEDLVIENFICIDAIAAYLQQRGIQNGNRE